MEGPIFRRQGEERLRELVPKLQVLARASGEDTRILARTLRELGERVAVVGSGVDDVQSLEMAQVGFSTGITGTRVARAASDVTMMSDSFHSIIRTVSWVRGTRDGLRKYIQVGFAFLSCERTLPVPICSLVRSSNSPQSWSQSF